jgi:hypothetical protein
MENSNQKQMKLGNGNFNFLDLSYLAGIIDGEGCFGLYRTFNKAKDQEMIRAFITVVNTNLAIIEKVMRILKSLDIEFGVIHIKPRNGVCKQSYQIVIRKRNAINRFISLISPFMASKKQQGEILVKFCSRPKNSHYTSEEFSLVDLSHKLNRKGCANG